MLTLGLDASALQQTVINLQATEDQARKALNSTMSKMAAWVRTRSVRGLSDTLKIPQNVLRKRLRTFRMQGRLSHALSDGSMKVWFGLNPVPWSSLKPRATRSGGVTAIGGRHDAEAFIAKYGKHEQVLKRIGKARNPLQVVRADIADPSFSYIERSVIESAAFYAQFMVVFERELRWRTQTQR